MERGDFRTQSLFKSGYISGEFPNVDCDLNKAMGVQLEHGKKKKADTLDFMLQFTVQCK